MTASLADLLFAAKNIAQAINDAARTYLAVQGIQSAVALTASGVVVTGSGRLATVSVIAGGSGSTGGTIYDTSTAGDTRFPIYAIPDPAGAYVVNLPFTRGLMLVPNTGATITLSYSTGTGTGLTGSN